MTSNHTTMVILLSTPVQILFIHTVLSRILRARSRQMVAIYAALAGYLPAGALLYLYSFPAGGLREQVGMIMYCFIVYTSLAYTYFHFFNTSETARRIRLLREIHGAGTLSEDEIEGLYKTADIIALRLRRLVEMGQLGYKDGYYYIQGRTLYHAALIMTAWQKLLKLR